MRAQRRELKFPVELHFFDCLNKRLMRFRLHSQNASSGQVKQNKTEIAALSLQVDALSPNGLGETICGSTSASESDAFRANGRVSLNVMGNDDEGEVQIGRYGDENHANGQHRYHSIKCKSDGIDSDNYINFCPHKGGNVSP